MNQIERFYKRYPNHPQADLSRTHKPELSDKCVWYRIALNQIKAESVPDFEIAEFRKLGCYECEGLDKTCPKYLKRSRG